MFVKKHDSSIPDLSPGVLVTLMHMYVLASRSSTHQLPYSASLKNCSTVDIIVLKSPEKSPLSYCKTPAVATPV